MSARKIRVGAWELHHHLLRPSRCMLQTHSRRLQEAITPPLDPIITFKLTAHPPTPHSPPKDDIPRTVSIHRCLLRAVGGPLEALVTAPFAESEMSEIVIHETFECFDVVRKFLYCQPIRMLTLPPDLPLVADRWGLTTLFEACFTHAEERAHSHAGVPELSVAELIMKYVPIMAIVDVPARFKTYLAVRLGIEIKTVDAYFKKNPVTPISMDDICCVEHDDSVTCRRRRGSVCAGKDQKPCTHIINAAAESASVKCMGELIGDGDEDEGLAEANREDTKIAQSPATSVSPVCTSPNSSVDNQSVEPSQESSKPLPQQPQPASDSPIPKEPSPPEESASHTDDPGDNLKNANGDNVSANHVDVVVADSDKPVLVDAGDDNSDDGATIESSNADGSNANGANADSVDADSVNADNANADNANADNANSDNANVDCGNVDIANADIASAGSAGAGSASADSINANSTNANSGTVDDKNPETADLEGNDVAGEDENGNGTVDSQVGAASTSVNSAPADAAQVLSDAGEEASLSAGGTSTNDDSISEMSVSDNSLTDQQEGSDAEKDASYLESDTSSSHEPLSRADWHDNFNIWEVFQSRDMLDEVIHYLSHFGPGDYTPLILDVVLRILEPKLTDDEITKLLRQIDWYFENPSCQTLNSESADAWSARAWRLLACVRVGFSGSGSDIRMSWKYSNLFRDMHARATELANRSNNDSDSDSSHSSVEEETDFTADWDEKAGDEHFEFAMSLQCDCMAWNQLSSLNLRIRLIESDDGPLDKQTGKREVSARIKVIESGCGCDLPVGSVDRSYQGFPLKHMKSRIPLSSYRHSGFTYEVMRSEDLDSWMKRHRKQCGMVFQVRLYVYPLEDDDDEKKKRARKEDQLKKECTCGYCECEDCSLAEEQEDQEEQEEEEEGN